MVKCIRDLKDGCKESDIIAILTVLNEGDEVVQNLEDVMSIIQNVIPITNSLKPNTINMLVAIISRSPLILAQLVAYIHSFEHIDAKNDKKIEDDALKVYRDIIVKVITKQSDCLFNNIVSSNGNKAELQYIKSLFFGSKLFNLLNTQISIMDYLESLNNQWRYICFEENFRKIPKPVQQYLGDLIVAELVLHPTFATDYLFDKLFLRDIKSYTSFLEIIKVTNVINSKKIIVKYLAPYLESKITSDTLSTVFIILSNLNAFKLFDSSSLLNIKSQELQEIIVRNIPSVTGYNIFSSLASKFAMIDDRLDSKISKLLVMILAYTLSKEQRQEISHNSEFLQTVTKRLGNMDYDVRERTMFIAKLVSNNELKYDSDYVIEIPNVAINMDDKQIVDLTKLHSETKSLVTINKSLPEVIGRLSIGNGLTVDVEESDSDDEDDELGQEIKDIVFLKDLLEMYVNFGRGTSGDQIPLLNRTTQLVRQKESLPLEVNYFAPALLTHISSINNNREEEGFEQWRINALVAILVVVPEQVENLYKILFNSELSIQQRISLLSSLALSARELRGVDDKQIHKPQYNFPSQRLPWDNGESTVKQIKDISGPNAITSSDISEGTTVWKSQKLSLQAKENSSQNKNRFKPIASSYFYPLVNGWKNGINLGSFDQLFKSHYVSTLRIIHNCAYPVHHYEMMTFELEQIITQAQNQGIPVLE